MGDEGVVGDGSGSMVVYARLWRANLVVSKLRGMEVRF